MRAAKFRFLVLGVLSAVALSAGSAQAAMPRSMAAIGDSMSNGFAARFGAFPAPDLSWSTGPSIDSHRERIEAAAGGRMAWANNYAKEGTWAAKPGGYLATQAQKVPLGTAYVTITLGTSELCSTHIDTIAQMNQRVAKIQGGLGQTLTILTRRNPGVRILVMSVPNWWGVWNTYQADSEMTAQWQGTSPPICPLLLQADSTDAQRNAVNAQNANVNGILAGVCADFAQCTFDDGVVYNASWSKEELSDYDGFHWTASGNAKAAALTWPKAGLSGSAYDPLTLRILINKAKRIQNQRVRVSVDTFPFADVNIVVKRRGRVVGRASGSANRDGDFNKRISVSSRRGTLKVVAKAKWEGQSKTASRSTS